MNTTSSQKRIVNFKRSKELAKRAHELIPGAGHTYSKGDDQFPELSPALIERGKGCRVWDVDGNEYIDWGMGLRSVILGHAYPRVIEAVAAELPKGSNFTRPSPLELSFAELLTSIIPSAEMVKFGKNGSDVAAGAIRLARAYTGRDRIAMSSQDPFYSFHDWFIGTTAVNSGIPSFEGELASKFKYGDLQDLERVLSSHPKQFAAVILEAVRIDPPPAGYLEKVKEIAHRHGAVLIFDEIITGFRWDLRGAQHILGVTPDLSTFGKAIANGFSVAVLAGKREIMELGGIFHKKPRVFLLSGTHGAETHGLAAAMATIQEIQSQDVIKHVWKVGAQLQEGLREAIAAEGLQKHIRVPGYPCSPLMEFVDASGAVDMSLRTLFLQETTALGVLIPYIAPSFSHQASDVEETLQACAAAFKVCAKALSDGYSKYLVGQPAKPVFRKFN